MAELDALAADGLLSGVVVEDARARGGSVETRFGAGSVCRDCAIWAEWAERAAIAPRWVTPRQKGAKLGAREFARLTGWSARTNEHGRDAAMLVFGR